MADGYGNSSVHKFSPEGQHLLSWGSRGTGPGQFSTPHGIWVDSHDRVYVADRENNRVQIFDTEGRFISEWHDFYHPMDIFMDAEDKIYVTDQILGSPSSTAGESNSQGADAREWTRPLGRPGRQPILYRSHDRRDQTRETTPDGAGVKSGQHR